MARIDFINELKHLGFAVQEIPMAPNKIYFEYTVPVGKNINKKVLMGFDVTDDFPMSCPGGPNFKTEDVNWLDPSQSVHSDNRFDVGWKYWSRPFPNWNHTDKTVKTYLAHIKNLLNNL